MNRFYEVSADGGIPLQFPGGYMMRYPEGMLCPIHHCYTGIYLLFIELNFRRKWKLKIGNSET